MSLHERNDSFHSDFESYFNRFNNSAESITVRPTHSESESDIGTNVSYVSPSLTQKMKDYIQRKFNSISTVIILAMTIIASVSIFISVTWLLVLIVQTKSLIPESRKLEYSIAYNRIKYYFSIPALVSSNIGALIISEQSNNATSYKYIRDLLTPVVNMHTSSSFFRGYFYYYHQNNSMAFLFTDEFKQSPTLLHYVQWDNESLGQNNLPDFVAKKTNSYEIPSLEPFEVDENSHRTPDFSLNNLHSQHLQVTKQFYYSKPMVTECFSNSCSLSLPYIVNPIGIDDFLLVVSLNLKHLQKGLTQYESKYDSFVLIFDPNSNYLIATSNPDAPQLHGDKPIRILDHPDQKINQVAIYLNETFGSKMQTLTTEVVETEISFSSVNYYFEASRIPFHGVDIILVFMTSEFEYLFNSFIAGIVLISISLCSIIFAILFGKCTSKVILRPVGQLIENMRQISEGFNFDTIQLGKTPYFTELQVLEDVFCALIDKLMLYRTFLPEHIIKNVESYKYALQSLKSAGELDDIVESASFVSVSQLVSPVNSTTSNPDIPSPVLSPSHKPKSHDIRHLEHKLKKQLVSSPSLELGISKEKATYLSIHIDFIEKKSVNINMMVFTNIMNCTSKIVSHFNGVVEMFNDGYILVGFNSMTPSAGHVRNACSSALRITEQIKMFPNYSQIASGGFKVGMGISTGNIHKGTIGSSLKRAWKSLGEPVNMAHVIARHALHLKVSIILDYFVRQHISRPSLQFRCIDIIITRHDNERKHFLYELSLVSLERSLSNVPAPLPHFFNSSSYSMNRSLDNDHWAHDYRVAFSYLMENEISEARVKMNSYLQRNTEDHVAEQILGIMDYIHRHSITFDNFVTSCVDSVNFSIAGITYFSILHHKSHLSWNNYRSKEHTHIELITRPNSPSSDKNDSELNESQLDSSIEVDN